jgi:transposase
MDILVQKLLLFLMSPSVVSRAFTRFRQAGSAKRRPGSGSERKTNQREDRYLHIQARRNPFMSAPLLQRELQNATGTRISDQTVRNRLKEVGLLNRRSVRRPKLTVANKIARITWVNQRIQEHFQWEQGLYTDESRFCVFSDSRRIRVWRTRGDRYRPEYTKNLVSFEGGGVMVWTGITFNGRTNLHLFDNNVNNNETTSFRST